MKPWAAYGFFYNSMGLVLKETESSVEIQYSEAQTYAPELWEKKFVKTFETPEELSKYIYDTWGNYSYEEAMNLLRTHFSSKFK